MVGIPNTNDAKAQFSTMCQQKTVMMKRPMREMSTPQGRFVAPPPQEALEAAAVYKTPPRVPAIVSAR